VPATPTLNGKPLTAAPDRLLVGIERPQLPSSTRRLGRELVRRAELLGRLEQEPDHPLVLLSAPAGYGKTTLLTQWMQDSPRPFAWVTPDENDAEPEILGRSIAAALSDIGIQRGSGRGFVLVLDDAHVLSPEVLADTVLGILGWLPDGSQLALASRCEPALPLGRMRAQRMLVEVGAEDLAMSAVEATSLLRKAGLDLEVTAVQSLVRRTEGWPAALALVAISCARQPEQVKRLAQLSGDDHLISEYLRAEILRSLPPAMLRFLSRTSVVDRLSGPLCDEVLERKRSALILAELARAHVPLAPLDASHEWYRLHPLLRDMLQTELRRNAPGEQAALHRRAASWYRKAGDLERAIDHSRSGEDLDSTAKLLWANLPRYLSEGRNHVVQRWLSGITPEGAAGCAQLALVAAHSHLALGAVAVAEQWARSAAVSLSEAPEPGANTERACVLLIEAWAARSGAPRMAEDAARAYDLLPDDSPWRASCCFLAGTAAWLIGDEAQAERRLEEGAARGAGLGADAESRCLAQLAVLAAERDQADLASDLARSARAVALEHGLGQDPTSALVFAVSAAAGLREGTVDEAKADLSRASGLLDELDDSLAWYGAEARILLARASLGLGDAAGARKLLADASRQARRTHGVVVFGRWFDEAWNQFDARAEATLAGVATLTTAELRVLRFLPTHYSFSEIAQRLHVSANTVKTHVHAVYRKLDACSRSEAVARATEAGLLGG
jgi:LuxR family transcriptional regulator, maltose regulon positive regulatory protein